MSDDEWDNFDEEPSNSNTYKPTSTAAPYRNDGFDNKPRYDNYAGGRSGGYERTGSGKYNSSRQEQPSNDRNWRDNKRHYNNDHEQSYGSHSHNKFRPRDRSNDEGGSSEIIEVSLNKLGMIIGKGGTKIREIQDTFQVKVNISREPNKNYMGEVEVQGSKSGIDDAVAHIKDLIQENYSNRSNERREPVQKESNNFYNESSDFEPIDWKGIAKRCEEADKERWANCPPLIKNFYKEHPNVAKMSPQAVAVFREASNNITVERLFLDQPKGGDPIPNPVQRFEECFSEYPDLLEQINNQGFKTPSPIQSQAWPILLKGEDMIGIAQTGTGKTLAFLLPAMIHTEYQPIPRGSQRGGPNVLVIAPTRELALQIEKEVAKYQFRGMKAVCVYGGGDRKAQINVVESGVEIVIATPGRLNDLVQAGVIDVNSITYLVLDEADRMLDMGFEPQIRKVLLNIRPDRQTVMTSATWPAGVRRLAQAYMKNPIQVCIGSLDLAAVHSVEQVIEILDEEDKFRSVLQFVKNMKPMDKIIIFCGKKCRADDLSSEISLEGIQAQCIHGDRDQIDREQALEDIKSGAVNILIATDVASRGIDIEDITHVLNYDFPRNIEEYVHRVGRTGRAGRTGISISYFTRENWGSAGELITILEEAGQEVPEELRKMTERFAAMKERREREKGSFNRGGQRGDRRGSFGGRRGNQMSRY